MEATMSGSALLGGRAGEQKDFDRRWRQALFDGVIADMASEGRQQSPAPSSRDGHRPPRMAECPRSFRTDPSVFDGRFANNAWLQECPQPFSKAVWGNAVEMAPEDANRLEIQGRRRGGDPRWRSLAFRSDAPIQWSGPGSAPALARLRPQACWRDRRRHRLQRRAPARSVVALDRAKAMSVRRDRRRRGRLSPATAGLFALRGQG